MGLLDDLRAPFVDAFGGEEIEAPNLRSTSDLLQDAIAGLSRNQSGITDLQRRDLQGQLGLFKDLQPQFTQAELDLFNEFAPQIQGAQISSARQTAPDIQALISEFDPDEPIRALLRDQILSELSSPTSLDPNLRRELEQNIRGGQSARGTGRGNSAVTSEAISIGGFQENLRRNRQNIAQQILKTNAATGINPASVALGSTPRAPGLGSPSNFSNPNASSNLIRDFFQSTSNQDNLQNQLSFNTDQINSQRFPNAINNAFQTGTSVAGLFI